MTATQADFARALLDPTSAAPPGLTNPDGTAAAKRFNVYRNNVVISLTKALEASFPVLLKLLGPDQFRMLAMAYLRAHPPATPMMMHYGQDMPAFLQDRVEGTKLGYLPDIARLELALRHAYHAADAAPVGFAQLQAMTLDESMAARIRFAPAVHLVRSRWPIHAIWRFHIQQNAPQPEPRGENILIIRPDFDPVPTLLLPGGGAFTSALMAGQSLGRALDDTIAQVPDFDLPAMLSLLINGAAITAIVTGVPE